MNAGPLGAQERRGPPHLLGTADPAGRDALCRRLLGGLHRAVHRGGALGRDAAGQQRVDGDPVAGEARAPASCRPRASAERSALDSISTPIGSRTEVEAIPTIRPQRRSRIPGTTARASAIGAITSVRCACSHCASENASGSGPVGGPPVLVTRMSISPTCSRTRATSVAAPSRSPLSHAVAGGGADLGRDRRRPRLVARGDHDPGALGDQHLGDGSADPLAGAADERDPSFDSKIHGAEYRAIGRRSATRPRSPPRRSRG